jgi:hypothetical protein
VVRVSPGVWGSFRYIYFVFFANWTALAWYPWIRPGIHGFLGYMDKIQQMMVQQRPYFGTARVLELRRCIFGCRAIDFTDGPRVN